MIYVYRNAASEGARELALALGGRKLRQSTQRGFYFKRANGERTTVRFGNNDTVVAWGESFTPTGGCRVLNGSTIRNKFSDAQVLQQAGVPTIEVSRTQPRNTPAPPPVDPAVAVFTATREILDDFPTTLARGRVINDGITQLVQQLGTLQAALRTPAPTAQPTRADGEWLPRANNHVGGNDLMTRPTRPDFWVKKLDLVEEFRVHSFQGRSIRAGVKRVRDGFQNPHPWIRSYDGGWSIVYDGVTSRQEHRDLAHRAVQALGLDFGAVDIGRTRQGQLIVLEVNRAPGLEGGTISRYAGAIRRWVDGTEE